MIYKLLSTKTMDKVLSVPSKYWAERKHFEHFNARTVDEAVSLLNDYTEEAKVIAGGVDLVDLMRNKVVSPKVVVNIKTIPALAYIRADAEGVKIGALSTIKDIGRSAIVSEKYRALAEAAHLVASPQVRNMATIGGNLCQDVRCWYYRRSPIAGTSFFCRRKGGELCYAEAGDNRYHAVLGRGECSAVCPSDMAPTLIALEAKIRIATPAGERIIPLEEFYTILGNTLKPNELITEIQLPTVGGDTRQRFLKFRLRKAIDFALSSVAAVLTIEAGVVSRARIVLGGVAPTPYRAIAAEEALQGKMVTKSVAEIAAEAAVSGAAPLSMNAYKIPITRTLVERTIMQEKQEFRACR